MPLHRQNINTERVSMPESITIPTTMERRKRARLPLSLKMYLTRKGDPHQYSSRTRDISSSGFFCFPVPVPFAPGEILECFILLPPGAPSQAETLCLTCSAKVVRLEHLEPNRFGLGCHIEEYKVCTFGAGPANQDRVFVNESA